MLGKQIATAFFSAARKKSTMAMAQTIAPESADLIKSVQKLLGLEKKHAELMQKAGKLHIEMVNTKADWVASLPPGKYVRSQDWQLVKDIADIRTIKNPIRYTLRDKLGITYGRSNWQDTLNGLLVALTEQQQTQTEDDTFTPER